MPTINEIIQAKSTPKAYPGYASSSEDGLKNPEYFEADKPTSPLKQDKVYIWALKANKALTVALGIKTDSSGHPSLTYDDPDGRYDGGMYSAGYVTQRADKIEIFLQSGRGSNLKLAELPFKRQCIEIHVAKTLMRAYGKQDVVFIDYNSEKPNELDHFIANETVDSTRRSYSADFVDRAYQLPSITPDTLSAATREQRRSTSSHGQISHSLHSFSDLSHLHTTHTHTESKMTERTPAASQKYTPAKNDEVQATGCFSLLFKRRPKKVAPLNSSIVESKKTNHPAHAF